LKIGSFTDPLAPNGHYPKLKGKGAEIKHFAEVLSNVWEQNMNSECDEHNIVADMLHDQNAIIAILDIHSDDIFLPPSEADVMQQRIKMFLDKYTQLGHKADARGDLLWNCTVKFHWLYHLGQRCHFLNPRRGACWIDEDYVGKWKVVAQACSRGSPLHVIPGKVIEKMRWGLHFLHEDMTTSLMDSFA
jgi:hypothetical protein